MARRMHAYRKLVFSRSGRQKLTPWNNAELVVVADDDELAAYLTDLKAQPGGVVAGRPDQRELKLLSDSRYENGVVRLHYSPALPAGKARPASLRDADLARTSDPDSGGDARGDVSSRSQPRTKFTASLVGLTTAPRLPDSASCCRVRPPTKPRNSAAP
jgi:hypothetical protein